ncbi:cytochrome P450 [Mycena capillaripes]|nr:cytochrome P450 [Mycena capillaripes]
MKLFLLFSPFLSISAYVFYRISKRIYRIYRSPLRVLPGPASVSWLYGSFSVVSESDAYRLFERWTREWGPTFKYSTSNKLYTTDLLALNHILSSDAWVKSNPFTRFSPGYKNEVGQGILFVEGTRHRQLGFAFSSAQIRGFADMFFSKSLQLKDIWMSELLHSSRTDGKLQVDAFEWMSRLALDTIGLAGFDYDFNSLHPEAAAAHSDDLLSAVRDLFEFDFRTIGFIVQLFFPLARFIPTKHSCTSAAAFGTIRRIGYQMVAEKKAILLNQGSFEKKEHIDGSDLLSLLIKPNLSSNTAAEERMSDEEIVYHYRVRASNLVSYPNLMHMSHRVLLAWTLFSLAVNPEVQKKLRKELQKPSTEFPTLEEVLSLPYLDAVVRESLRLHAPVPFTERVATRTDIVPLQSTVVERDGTVRNTILVNKGDKVYIPIRAVNRSEELWGPNAEDFSPERWTDNTVPDAVKDIPSIWSSTMSFLSGTHACIGYRVALVEMKTMLFTLVRNLEFELAISAEDIGRRNNIVGRPYLISDPAAGNQLPMLVRPAKIEE